MDGLRDEYVTPGQFLFGMLVGTLTSVLMSAATRTPLPTSPQLELEEGSPSLPTSRRYEMLPLERFPDTNLALLGHTRDELAFGLNALDSAIPPGGRLAISLVSSESPTDIELETFVLEAAWAGLEVSYPTTEIIDGLATTTFIITKGPPGPPGTTSWALALIPIIPTILIVGLVAFAITQIGTITKALLPILIVTISGIILLGALLTRRHVMEAVGPAVKRKYLPKTELLSAESRTKTEPLDYSSEFITVDEPGKTTFKKGDVVSLEAFMKENERVKELGEAPASGTYKIEPKKNGNGGNLLEWLGDSPEFLAYTIDNSGWRAQIDQTFQEAIARARK